MKKCYISTIIFNYRPLNNNYTIHFMIIIIMKYLSTDKNRIDNKFNVNIYIYEFKTIIV